MKYFYKYITKVKACGKYGKITMIVRYLIRVSLDCHIERMKSLCTLPNGMAAAMIMYL